MTEEQEEMQPIENRILYINLIAINLLQFLILHQVYIYRNTNFIHLNRNDLHIIQAMNFNMN